MSYQLAWPYICSSRPLSSFDCPLLLITIYILLLSTLRLLPPQLFTAFLAKCFATRFMPFLHLTPHLPWPFSCFGNGPFFFDWVLILPLRTLAIRLKPISSLPSTFFALRIAAYYENGRLAGLCYLLIFLFPFHWRHCLDLGTWSLLNEMSSCSYGCC